jgi:arylsulfatase A-like enzyme
MRRQLITDMKSRKPRWHGLVPAALIPFLGFTLDGQASPPGRRPNVVVVLADQWRAQAFGFAGDPNVQTPHLDALAEQSVRMLNAIAGLPVCCPARATLLTGQRPLTHGVFLNDVPLDPKAVSLAKVLREAGYDTAYIGKWHLNGDGRSKFIPRSRRQGFEYWKALECTHDYWHSFYYADGPKKLEWPGYDALAQTQDADAYLRAHADSGRPFFLMLSWGPPHDPYSTAPARYRALYDAAQLILRPNVPPAIRAHVRSLLAGYYGHCSALDHCLGLLLGTLNQTRLATNTILLFTADHGAMLGSHGLYHKQQPYDESIRVPMLFRWPGGLNPRTLPGLICQEDVMPTLLGLCGVPIPATVQGRDESGYLRGGSDPSDGAVVISCIAPFGEWDRRHGGKEFRGLRTRRYTYVRDLHGPWLLFDDRHDPYQTNNLANVDAYAKVQSRLDRRLDRKLAEQKDRFLAGDNYIDEWGYHVDRNGTVPYTP